MTEEELFRSDATIGEFIRRYHEYEHHDKGSSTNLEDVLSSWTTIVQTEGRDVQDIVKWYGSFAAFIKDKKKELGIVDPEVPFDCGPEGVWRDIEEYDDRMKDVIFFNGDDWNIYGTPCTTHFLIIPSPE